MSSRRQFEIIFDEAVVTHVAAMARQDRVAVLDAIEQQLRHEAIVRTRDRKPLRIPNTLNATWELRCGPNNRYRVLHDVDVEESVVIVLAIGRKAGNRLTVGSEEFEL
jgi:mRNA-degrading endonuclease RelE of RelBE toxin-antitoxin system